MINLFVTSNNGEMVCYTTKHLWRHMRHWPAWSQTKAQTYCIRRLGSPQDPPRRPWRTWTSLRKGPCSAWVLAFE